MATIDCRRIFKKADQRGRSKRGGEAYSFPYVEPLSAARTKLADFFKILLGFRVWLRRTGGGAGLLGNFELVDTLGQVGPA